jgi:hypothetical protein
MWSRFGQAGANNNTTMPKKAARKQARPENNRAGLRREGKPHFHCLHPQLTAQESNSQS